MGRCDGCAVGWPEGRDILFEDEKATREAVETHLSVAATDAIRAALTAATTADRTVVSTVGLLFFDVERGETRLM